MTMPTSDRDLDGPPDVTPEHCGVPMRQLPTRVQGVTEWQCAECGSEMLLSWVSPETIMQAISAATRPAAESDGVLTAEELDALSSEHVAYKRTDGVVECSGSSNDACTYGEEWPCRIRRLIDAYRERLTPTDYGVLQRALEQLWNQASGDNPDSLYAGPSADQIQATSEKLGLSAI